MTARAFADTNIVVYAESADGEKTRIATAIMENAPVISAQVVNETVSVLTRKHRFTLPEAHDIATSLLDLCEVMPVNAGTIREGIRLAARYGLSHWDSLIVAAALAAGCETLYSEDLHTGQTIEQHLKVVNPFLNVT